MAKYYPSSKTAMLRNEIHTFQQEDGESLGEAWDRYQDLIASCPHHGIPEWYITQTFFQTLLPRTKEMVNASAGGGFDHLSDEEGTALIKKMVDSEANYGSRGNMLRRNGKFPKENTSNSETNAKLDLLTKQFEKFSKNQVNQAATSYGPPMEEVAQVSSCELCGGSGHTYDLCGNNYNGAYEENAQEVNAFQSYNNNPRPPRPPYNNPNTYNPNTNFYHPGLKNHPNFSYKSTNVQNPQHLQSQTQNNPPGFAQPRGILPNPRNNFGNQNQWSSNNQPQNYGNQQQGYQEFGGNQSNQGNQVNQANQGFGQGPPDGLLAQGQSSKDASNSHHAHAVVLRSGLELEDPYKDLELEVDEDPKGNGLEMDDEEESSPIEVSGKANEDKKGKKACEVGGVPISRALCDLGASVSVIPLKVAKRIGIQNLAPTTMTLQLADRSVKRPMGVLEDVPVKVGKFLIPTDFVVLDIGRIAILPSS
ncbi:uncharacterized protein LOC141648907 [Silene latifolia]|uniref:uncharacterized protein LOC141648907 n=1 Tax=Silene latifolia TaxID=37657 RepID=UPI003D78AD1D